MAKGRLLYFGNDSLQLVDGWVVTIGAALHFAARNLDGFREYLEESQPGAPIANAQVLSALRGAHELASPACQDPL